MWSLLWCIERCEGTDGFSSPEFGGLPALQVTASWDARRSVAATLAAFAALGPVTSAAFAQAPPPPGDASSTIDPTTQPQQLGSDPSDEGDDAPDPAPPPTPPAPPPSTPPVVVVTPDAGEFDPDAAPAPPAPPAAPAPAPPPPPVEPLPDPPAPPAPPVAPVEPPAAPTPPAPPTPPPAPVAPTPSGEPVAAAAPAPPSAARRAARARRGASSPTRPRASRAPQRTRFTPPATSARRLARPAPSTVVSSWSAEVPTASGQTHLVTPGESLWQVASQQAGPGASNTAVAAIVSHLWTLNARAIGTGDPNVLRVGTTLRMPEIRRA